MAATTKYRIVPLTHARLDATHAGFVEYRIQQVAESWRGTRYVRGQQRKGVAVDCVRFVCGVLDELYGFAREDVPRLPFDTAFHNEARATKAMGQIMSLYEPHVEVHDATLEAGDVVVVGSGMSGPAHALVAGTQSLYHILKWTGVTTTTPADLDRGMPVHGIYRMLDKDRWAT